jgi:hypothetical protein
MRVEIGPVPLPSASAWLDYATNVIEDLRGAPGAVTSGVLDAFSKYVDDWQATADRAVARGDEVFRWSGQAAPETVEYLVFALYRLGERLTEEQRSGARAPRPPEAQRFHTVLVRSVLAALEREGDAEAHFVAHLREVWGPASDGT